MVFTSRLDALKYVDECFPEEKDGIIIMPLSEANFPEGGHKHKGEIKNMYINKQDYDHLRDVVGSLMIEQFKDKDKQDQYRAVINMIFEQYPRNTKKGD